MSLKGQSLGPSHTGEVLRGPRQIYPAAAGLESRYWPRAQQVPKGVLMVLVWGWGPHLWTYHTPPLAQTTLV